MARRRKFNSPPMGSKLESPGINVLGEGEGEEEEGRKLRYRQLQSLVMSYKEGEWEKGEEERVRLRVAEEVVKGGGLISEEVRGPAWSLLLKADKLETTSTTPGKPHRDEAQVALDVNRSFNTYPKFLLNPRKTILRNQLTTIIRKVLRREPQLNYFQGYHDIAACLLLTIGPKRSVNALHSLSLYYLRDAMQADLHPILNQLNLIFPLLRQVDPTLHSFLVECEIQAHYAISWVLTWGTHDVTSLALAARLVEFTLATHPAMPLYVATAVTLQARGRLLTLELDYAVVHSTLSKLLRTVPHLPALEIILSHAHHLYQQYPPDRLQSLPGAVPLHPHSCLTRFTTDFLTPHHPHHHQVRHLPDLSTSTPPTKSPSTTITSLLLTTPGWIGVGLTLLLALLLYQLFLSSTLSLYK